MTTTKPDITVYCATDPEAWCPKCLVHWAVLMDVFRLTTEGVTAQGVYLRCFVCGIWESEGAQCR